MISRIPGKAFLLVAFALCVPAAWLLGNDQAEKLSREQLEQVKAEAEQEQLQLQATLDSLKADIRLQALTLEIAEARAVSLQLELDNSVKQSIDDAAELALYRRIGGAESERGIWVDDIHRVKADSDVLSITLVQARGRDRASGAIGVTLLSNQDGHAQRWILADSERGVLSKAMLPDQQISQQADELLASPLRDDVVKVASFDLRFFQTLLVKVENITTISPEYVEIWTFPEGKRLKPHLQRFRWPELDVIDEQ